MSQFTPHFLGRVFFIKNWHFGKVNLIFVTYPPNVQGGSCQPTFVDLPITKLKMMSQYLG